MHDLTRFTPAGGLNRDETLLAMGRASARPNSFWRWLCVGLLVTNLVTLVIVCWPKRTVVPSVHPVPGAYPSQPAVPAEPSSVLMLSRDLEPVPTSAGTMLSYPVLRAGSTGIE